MRFGILVIPYMRSRGEQTKMTGSDPARFQVLMERLREQMVAAEGWGYDSFCMTEQHLQVEGVEPTTNPIMWDYFVAQHTKTMRVGQLGMNLTAVNPIKLAEDLAMLDHFTGGRTFCGFTRGNTPRWTATFGQHLGITSTHSDKSESDRRNRAAFYENWRLVKALWTEEIVNQQGEFWKAPLEVEWRFNPTDAWGRGCEDHRLTGIGIVPRPLQKPHPPVYSPFSYSMETGRFWAREGGKLVSFVTKDDFLQTTLDVYMQEAHGVGRDPRPADALAIGGHLVMGRNPAETEDIYRGFEELFNFAYNTPPYHVPMGRLWKGDGQEALDHVAGLAERFKVDEFFLWHHVGYFPQEQELAMLERFADGVIRKLNG